MTRDPQRVNAICTFFSQQHWHDSKLMGFRLVESANTRAFDLHVDLDLIVQSTAGGFETRPHCAIFQECRNVCAELDLLAVALCSRHIFMAVCHRDVGELEGKMPNKIEKLDFLDPPDPLEDCIGFSIEMVDPGGEILILAKGFELVEGVCTK